MENKITKVSWDEYFQLVNRIGDVLEAWKNRFHVFYGVPRGGLVAAVILSHRFNKPMITNLGEFLKERDLGKFQGVCVVDDVADTGRTLHRLQTHLLQYEDVVATLHYKPQSMVKPDIIGKTVSNDEWLVYPYEQDGLEGVRNSEKE